MSGLKSRLGEYFFGSETREALKHQIEAELEFIDDRNSVVPSMIRKDLRTHLTAKYISNAVLALSILGYAITKNPLSFAIVPFGECVRAFYDDRYIGEKETLRNRRRMFIRKELEREEENGWKYQKETWDNWRATSGGFEENDDGADWWKK